MRAIRLITKALRRRTADAPARAAILLFHRIAVVDEGALGPDRQLSVSPAAFEKVIAGVASDFRPLPLAAVVESLAGGTELPERTIVVTFDDGFRDTLTAALPVLARYGVPATVYVTTGFIDGSVPPYEYAIASILRSVPALDLTWEGVPYHWILATADDRERCYREIKAIGKPLSREGREELVRRLAPTQGTQHRARLYMTPDELGALARSDLIEIGAHTHSHLLLPALEPGVARADIEQGRRVLEDMIGGPVRHFSYPYGGHDERVIRVVRRLRFASAVTTRHAMVSARPAVHALPRIEVRGTEVLDCLAGEL